MNPFPESYRLFYHDNLSVNKNYNYSFYDLFRKKYAQHTSQLTNHVIKETEYQDVCETDNDEVRGVFIRPTIMFWLLNRYPEVTQAITTPIPPDEKNVLVLNWLTLFNLSDDDRDMIFGLYKGHVFIDDTFEVHPTRTYVMEMLLKDLGYNLDKVTFWTNCPTPDNRFEKSIIRHNWLHLQEYGRMLNETTRFKIPVFDDDKLLDYENKKYKVLSLNGHSTYPREYILKEAIKAGLVNKENNSNEMRYSMVDAWKKLPSNCWFKFPNRNEWVPRMLPNDADELWIRDRTSNSTWWEESFFNLNVETNLNWITPNVRLITEKWMKSILYLTPAFNIGEYPGLEEYHKYLGFNNYENHIDRRYDSIDDFATRCKTMIQIIKDTPMPDKKQWKMMNRIAIQNREHFYNFYIPELEKTFISTLLKKTYK